MELIIRKALSGEETVVTRVNVRTWKTAYRGIVAQAFLDALDENSGKRRAHIRADIAKGNVFAALDGEAIVGFASFGPARDEPYTGFGEVYALYVLEAYEHRGLGRRLLTAALCELEAQGFRRAVIVCFSENPACRFYEKLGGRRAEERTFPIGGKDYRAAVFEYGLSKPAEPR